MMFCTSKVVVESKYPLLGVFLHQTPIYAYLLAFKISY